LRLDQARDVVDDRVRHWNRTVDFPAPPRAGAAHPPDRDGTPAPKRVSRTVEKVRQSASAAETLRIPSVRPYVARALGRLRRPGVHRSGSRCGGARASDRNRSRGLLRGILLMVVGRSCRCGQWRVGRESRRWVRQPLNRGCGDCRRSDGARCGRLVVFGTTRPWSHRAQKQDPADCCGTCREPGLREPEPLRRDGTDGFARRRLGRILAL
jgi:hypothetical protein